MGARTAGLLRPQINSGHASGNQIIFTPCDVFDLLQMGPRMTCLLAFDTSTQTMSVALVVGGEVLLYDGPGGASASGQLITQAQRLMAQASLNWTQLDAIAFGRGPGAFTGLRTACAVAQGLALGADKPVLPLDSLMVVAQDACVSRGADAMETREPIWVLSDARMGEVYAASYQRQPASATHAAGHWQACVPPFLSQPQALQALWADNPPLLQAGNALLAFRDIFLPSARCSAATHFPEAQIRAHALAAVAVQAWAQGLAVDAALALPLYVRDKVAQTTAERAALRGAAVRTGVDA